MSSLYSVFSHTSFSVGTVETVFSLKASLWDAQPRGSPVGVQLLCLHAGTCKTVILPCVRLFLWVVPRTDKFSKNWLLQVSCPLCFYNGCTHRLGLWALTWHTLLSLWLHVPGAIFYDNPLNFPLLWPFVHWFEHDPEASTLPSLLGSCPRWNKIKININ